MGKKAAVFDMDGVVFVGSTPVKGAGEELQRLRRKKICVLFATNNATKTREQFVEKLEKMGIGAQKDGIMCAAYGMAQYLRAKYRGKRKRAFVVGEQGLFEEIKNAGFEIINAKQGKIADFVACGLDRQFTYAKAAGALSHLLQGAEFFAANADATLPTEKGLMPGSGSIVAMLEKACGKKAFVVGKPNALLLRQHLKAHGINAKDAAFFGDRLDIDIAVANKCKMHSVLVLSGIAREKDAKKAKGAQKPQHVIKSAAHAGKVLEKLGWI